MACTVLLQIKAELDKSLDEMSQMAFPLPENVNYRKKVSFHYCLFSSALFDDVA